MILKWKHRNLCSYSFIFFHNLNIILSFCDTNFPFFWFDKLCFYFECCHVSSLFFKVLEHILKTWGINYLILFLNSSQCKNHNYIYTNQQKDCCSFPQTESVPDLFLRYKLGELYNKSITDKQTTNIELINKDNYFHKREDNKQKDKLPMTIICRVTCIYDI